MTDIRSGGYEVPSVNLNYFRIWLNIHEYCSFLYTTYGHDRTGYRETVDFVSRYSYNKTAER